MFKAQKRFIAGAVCPRCSEMDKLTVFIEDGKDFRECVSCGFKEQMFLQSAPKELETRVNLTDEEKLAETKPVRLVDPGSSS
ncbi:MAG: YheV family putative zinc ribbon protein [Porticoccus sp.]|nr:YheV family putative zinc ribbon protein [Porticoccus sp.]